MTPEQREKDALDWFMKATAVYPERLAAYAEWAIGYAAGTSRTLPAIYGPDEQVVHGGHL